ncbi:MAG TPA: undecaprenyl-diphosphate phosphatase [Flavihumibacter sp.]|jgi:undecaprenyl-diphosphatase
MSIFEAIIIAIVEGLTEFLPVSSTGHMIITSSLLGIHTESFTKLFEVAIQLGAILAVVVLYWKKFVDFKSLTFYFKLALAVVPALVLGFLFSDQIDEMLESPLTVAITLLLGGFVLIIIDRYFQNPQIHEEEQIGYGKALTIGFWQCLAMIPGVSRSAASIIGGMQQKLSRKVAAEFSFFLAVPTMAAASAYSLILKKWPAENGETQKGYELLLNSSENMTAFIVGNVVAFIVALLAIKFFIGFLQKNGFKWFGYYRIAAGLILLILLWTGVIHNG